MISIILPCYNEEALLQEAFTRFTRAAEALATPYEIIIVDDGSTDNSQKLLVEFSRNNPQWKIIRLSRNFGHQSAISCGLHYATGEAVIVMDMDLQDPPEELPRFLSKWREGYEVVYGIRRKRKEGVLKRMTYSFFYRIVKNIAEIEIPLDAGDFCLLDKKVVHLINSLPENNRYVRGLRSWIGFRQTGLEYERQERFRGRPKYTFFKLVALASAGIFSFSKIPLRVISIMGILFSMTSFIGIIFFVLHRILDFKIFGYSPKDVPGTATIVISILFMGGIQLICLSVLGEYLGIIFNEVKRRPVWIVEKFIGMDKNTNTSPT